MDAQRLYKSVIDDFISYLKSFIVIRDQRIENEVKKAFSEHRFLPEPLIHFNPSYKTSCTIQNLEDELGIHKDIPNIFGTYELYQHQVDAITLGLQEKDFIVTSGTGSGKSLTYMATIFDNILKNKRPENPGIKAILVYPMNALINSQEEEIRKFHLNFLLSKNDVKLPSNQPPMSLKDQILLLKPKVKYDFPITYARYTGQEDKDERDRIKNMKPDIILTNYMMLELIMTRVAEDWFRTSIKDHLRFLVFDELHTYRGRQGADVAMLVRRIQHHAKNEIICIGTSATMASEGTQEARKEEVSKVGEKIFNKKFEPDQIIEETLIRSTTIHPDSINEDLIKKSIIHIENFPQELDLLKQNALMGWLENRIALNYEGNLLRRGNPQTISNISEKLASDTGLNIAECKQVVEKLLQAIQTLNKRGMNFLPFKIHQFISQTNTVYVTLEDPENRFITVAPALWKKDDEKEKLLYPVLFSRYTGHDFLSVELDTERNLILPRDPNEDFEYQTETDYKKFGGELNSAGYLVFQYEGDADYWNNDMLEMLPDSWFSKRKGERVLKNYYQNIIPRKIFFNADGDFAFEKGNFDQWAWYMPAKLRIDITAGIVYDIRTKESTKLMFLGNEGRSSSTSILTFNVLKALNDQNEPENNQKLLSFTDNRQDASLQAGHFNDFVSTIRLRSALYKALKKEGKLKIYEIPSKVVDCLDLKESNFARNPQDDYPDPENKEALTKLIQIRILYDLERGWRYVLPNLEQCALLKIEYDGLNDIAPKDELFKDLGFLSVLEPEERKLLLSDILDYFRTNFAISNQILDSNITATENFLREKLDESKLWSLDRGEKIRTPYTMIIKRPGKVREKIFPKSIGPLSQLGKYLKKQMSRYSNSPTSNGEYEEFAHLLVEFLVKMHFLKKEQIRGNNGIVDGYRLRTDKISWLVGDDITAPVDRVRYFHYKQNIRSKPNQFFQELYRYDFSNFKKELEGREHTGQVATADRIDRESRFRNGEISALFCSPTMELGIDIADLNIVHMRNVPPNPANYAQRSGRAGRSGETAVIFTYCSSWSPHDRNFFQEKERMVAGSVIPPRIDLINEELMETHLNAFILKELGISSMEISVADVLDVSDLINIPIKQQIIDQIQDHVNRFEHDWAKEFSIIIDPLISELEQTDWFNQKWILAHIRSFKTRFDKAFDRWRMSFNAAMHMKNTAESILGNMTVKYGSPEHKEAKRQRAIAEMQIALLKNDLNRKYGNDSEFYIFRYLAAEGFLPGYNFTRLPIRIFVGNKYKDAGEYISRARFIALKEFGPQNLIYHNGNKYQVNRLVLTDIDRQMRDIKISKETGYIFLDQEARMADNDVITGNPLKSEKSVSFLSNVIELAESEAKPRERISCEEEERTSRGYDIRHYFRYPKGLHATKKAIIKFQEQKLIHLIYGPATELVLVNYRWMRSKDMGFKIHKKNGIWLNDKNAEKAAETGDSAQVVLLTRNTADTLYIQPMENLNLDYEGIVTLSFVLKNAISTYFQIEEDELLVEIMGEKEIPNILLYEAAEGSLGILSQLVKNTDLLHKIFRKAYQLLYFDPENKTDTRPDLPKATYDDLLSYYNQRFHEYLDRYKVKEALEFLMECSVAGMQNEKDYDEQYSYLLDHYDKNSDLEKRFLDYLYQHNLALPDEAQYNVPDFFVNADFMVKTEYGVTLIFVDGSVHDDLEVKKDDQNKRTLLRDRGYDVLEWYYQQPIEEFISQRRDIFRKVR